MTFSTFEALKEAAEERAAADREVDARWAADHAIRMMIEEMRNGGDQHSPFSLVSLALDILAESRRQVAAAPGPTP